MELPNQLGRLETRALGLGYEVMTDQFVVTASINFSSKIQKMRTGPNLLEAEIENQLPVSLTKRHILSQLMGTFDPLGLACPVTMKGSILFRKVWQMSKGDKTESVDWDKPVSEELRQECLQ